MKKYFQFVQLITEGFYKREEDKTEDEKFHDKLLQILRNYGPVSISKNRASEIIQRIIGGERKYSEKHAKSNAPSHYKMPILGEDVDFNFMKPSNKVRMYDYLQCLLETKTIRGDSFEGLISGLYHGVVSKDKSSKFDVILDDGEKLSVKFVDSIQERPVLGNIRNDIVTFIDSAISKKDIGYDFVYKEYTNELKDESLNDILNIIGPEDSYYLLNNIAFSTVSQFLIAYPEDPNDIRNFNIICILLTREELLTKYIKNSNVRYAPKQKGSYQIRVNITALKSEENTYKEWILKAPVISTEDINYLMIKNDKDAYKLLGTDKDRVRGSILNSILDFGEFKDIGGKEYFIFDFEKYKEERGY